MPKTIMFTNLNSGKNLRDRHRVRKLQKMLGNKGVLFATKDYRQLEGIVSQVPNYNPDRIIIDGGDGSVTAFLSTLLPYWPKEKKLPPVGITAGGTFNMLSKHCKVHPKRYLSDIIHAEDEELYYQGIDMMKITDSNGLATYGFSFGVGLPITLLEEYYKQKRWKMFKIALIAGRLIFSQMFRHKYYKLFANKTELEVTSSVEGKDYECNGKYLGIMAQTIESAGSRLIHPFYKAQQKPGFFHAMGTVMGLDNFLPYALPFALGKVIPGMGLDIQTNLLDLKSEAPIKYHVNGEFDFIDRAYCADKIKVEHGLTLNIIKASPKQKP